MKLNRKFFFDTVRSSLFGGQLSAAQVTALNGLLDAAESDEFGLQTGDEPYIAYPLATAYHETGRQMKPVREGFAATDAGARKAVANLYAKGVIKRNYALPHANGNSYYGRGQVQLTHGDNYKKASPWVGVDLYAHPDLMLDPKISAKVLFKGMDVGAFTGRSMNDYFLKGEPDYFNARSIINADKNKLVGRKRRGKTRPKMGDVIAGFARKFEKALKFVA